MGGRASGDALSITTAPAARARLAAAIAVATGISNWIRVTSLHTIAERAAAEIHLEP